MDIHRGDVVLAFYPFASGIGGSRRPAVVVQDDRDNVRMQNTSIAQITTNLHRAGEPTHLLIEAASPEGQQAGELGARSKEQGVPAAKLLAPSSPLPAPRSPPPAPRSLLPAPCSLLPAPRSPLPAPRSPLPAPRSLLPRSLLPAPCSLLPAPCSAPAPCSLLPAPCSLLPAPCSLLPAPCSPLPAPCSLLPAPRSLSVSLLPAPCSLLPAPCSPLPAPRSLLPAPCSPLPAPSSSLRTTGGPPRHQLRSPPRGSPGHHRSKRSRQVDAVEDPVASHGAYYRTGGNSRSCRQPPRSRHGVSSGTDRRENVGLNGAILGMTKREIDQTLDEIVDFAGVEKFVDTPVKRYSSGIREPRVTGSMWRVAGGGESQSERTGPSCLARRQFRRMSGGSTGMCLRC